MNEYEKGLLDGIIITSAVCGSIVLFASVIVLLII